MPFVTLYQPFRDMGRNDNDLHLFNMITQTMTSCEVIRVLRMIDNYVVERMNGLMIKNKKKLKSKFFKDNSIMSKSGYVVPKTNDSIVVYAIKQVQTLKGKEYSTMSVNYYIKTYYNTYIVPSINGKTERVCGYIEYSCHSVQRLRERLGKDFDMFFQEDYLNNKGYLQFVEYKYNGDENEYVAHIGEAFVITEREDSGRKYAVKTILSEKDLYTNQLLNKQKSKEGGEALWLEKSEQMDVRAEANLKLFKKMGIVRPVA